MEKWLKETCEHDGRPDGYMHPQLNETMATAAAAVYDATFDAQAFAQQERGDAP